MWNMDTSNFTQNKWMYAVVVWLALLVSGCAGPDAKQGSYQEQPLDVLHQKATDALRSGKELEAASLFTELERQYPGSDESVRAPLMAAYAYYLHNDYAKALDAVDRFLLLHPGDKLAGYAYYLRAICYYEQIGDPRRDQENTQLALQSLEAIMNRFPDTPYAEDAYTKLALVRDRLASKHMEVGRYYQRHQEFLASVNRFRTVVAQYQTTTQTPEALHRLVESYLALGLLEEAQAAAAVLGRNYPQSLWYANSYALLTGRNPNANSDSPDVWHMRPRTQPWHPELSGTP